MGSCESADSPDGKSTATTGMPEALTSATTVSSRPDNGAFSPVPKIASTISVQWPISEKCSSHAWLSAISTIVRPEPSKNFKVDPRVTSDLRDEADEKHGNLDAALDQRPRDDESVTAVVASAAQHGHTSLEQIGVDRLDGRDHLPAGVFHQHE